MKSLELKVPPIVWVLLHAVGMWCLSSAVPVLSFTVNPLWVPAFVLTGLSVALSGVAAFRSARTTVNPMQPDKASRLVIVGIYRYTRNPMYVGMLLVLFGWFLYLGNFLSGLMLPSYIFALNRFQIEPEERILRGRFGDEYSEYTRRVSRWVGF